MPIPMPPRLLSAVERGRGGMYFNIFLNGNEVFSGLEPWRRNQEILDAEAAVEQAELERDSLLEELETAEEELEAAEEALENRVAADTMRRTAQSHDVDVVATGGTFTLTIDGAETSALAYNAAASAIQSALEAEPTVVVGDLSVSGASPNYVVTYRRGGNLYGEDAPSLSANDVDLVHTDEVQTLTIDATGGTYTLRVGGQTTTAIAWNASASTIQTALEALSTVDPGDIVVTGTGPYTHTFGGQYASTDVALIVTDDALLTGGAGTATMVETTPGVAPTLDVTANNFAQLIVEQEQLRPWMGAALTPTGSDAEISGAGIAYVGASGTSTFGTNVEVIATVDITDAPGGVVARTDGTVYVAATADATNVDLVIWDGATDHQTAQAPTAHGVVGTDIRLTLRVTRNRYQVFVGSATDPLFDLEVDGVPASVRSATGVGVRSEGPGSTAFSNWSASVVAVAPTERVESIEELVEGADEEIESLQAQLDALEDRDAALDAPFSVTSATATQDLTRPVRRSLTLQFTGGVDTVPAGLLAALSPLLDSEVRAVWRGGGAFARWLRFTIVDVSWSLDTVNGVVSGSITGAERMGLLVDVGLPSVRQFDRGEDPTLIAERLIRRFDPGATRVQIEAAASALDAKMTFDPATPIIDVLAELGEAGGFTVYTDNRNVYHIAPIPEVIEGAQHTYTEGDPRVLEVTRTILDDEIVNGVIVYGDDPESDADPVRTSAWLESGALSRFGRVGPRPIRIDVPTNNQARCERIAVRELRRNVGLPHKVGLQILPNPSIEVGDTIAIRFPTLLIPSGNYLVERVSYRMGDAAMTVDLAQQDVRQFEPSRRTLAELNAESL